MTNLKWADVAHMYSMTHGTPDREYVIGMFSRPDYKPILRHLDDMTEEEARELFAQCHSAPFSHTGMAISSKSPLEYYRNEYFRKNTMHNQWRANEFHWLISKGFDVFGLIESGEAIRKEKTA